MAGPIVQMSRHRQTREAVPHVALSQHGKVRREARPGTALSAPLLRSR